MCGNKDPSGEGITVVLKEYQGRQVKLEVPGEHV